MEHESPPAQDQNPPVDPALVPQNDPFPKMIIVCMIIAGILLLIIFATVFFDLVVGNRNQQEVKPFEYFEAPPGTIEGNTRPPNVPK
jgi:hypothetical protein